MTAANEEILFWTMEGFMDTTVVDTVAVEVQELTLAELAQIGGGFGEAVLA